MRSLVSQHSHDADEAPWMLRDGSAVNRHLSVYLDTVRFLAALAVFLSHVCAQSMSGGFLWQCMHLGAPALVVFFVLSGFVIRDATQRTATAREYVVSRAARIYSVVLPTLGMTLLLDMGGRALRPELYDGVQPLLADPRTLLAALSFLNCAWGGDDWSRVGSNCSYWSLGFEVPYYVLFGFLWFGRGLMRALGVIAMAALTGTSVMLLSPLWFLGVGAHWLCEKWRPGPQMSWALFLGGGAAALTITTLHNTPVSLTEHSSADLAVDAIVAVAFAAHMIGFRWLPPNILHRSLERCELPIRWMAGTTFTLYLLHVPAALFFKSLAPWSVDSWQFRTGILLTPLVASIALAQVTERKKQAWRQWFDRIVPGRTDAERSVLARHPVAAKTRYAAPFPQPARMDARSRNRSSAG